ncbi:MAG: hypothetical protein JWO80_5108 [Bryobacterales bacterium]|nr:hypothetical protein [Bryobacterales bacterium]
MDSLSRFLYDSFIRNNIPVSTGCILVNAVLGNHTIHKPAPRVISRGLTRDLPV